MEGRIVGVKDRREKRKKERSCSCETWYQIGSRVDKCEGKECSPQSFHADDNLKRAVNYRNKISKISNSNWDEEKIRGGIT